MERVTAFEGKTPVIFVAPHGQDDSFSNVIAQSAAEAMNAYLVANNGWKRADTFDYDQEHANCNNINHCLEDVVKEEFLDPIVRYKNKIKKKYNEAFIFYIHGMSSKQDVSMVVGHGNGHPPSFSCDPWRKNLFIYLCEMDDLITYEGGIGGPFSGWSKTNLNQYFRKWEPDSKVQSMQIEIARNQRSSIEKAEFFGETLAAIIKEFINHSHWNTPSGWKTRQY